MPIRIDEDIHKRIMVAKQLFDAANVSDTLRLVFDRAFPDLDELVNSIEEREAEKQALLEAYIKQYVEGGKS